MTVLATGDRQVAYDDRRWQRGRGDETLRVYRARLQRFSVIGHQIPGAEYLTITYDPEYNRPESLGRLRKRGLGKKINFALQNML
jgi:hypothetical protein